jgi:hypothetical protein
MADGGLAMALPLSRVKDYKERPAQSRTDLAAFSSASKWFGFEDDDKNTADDCTVPSGWLILPWRIGIEGGFPATESALRT